jgi:hypothetical protein
VREHRFPDADLKFMEEIDDEQVVVVLSYIGLYFRECILLDMLALGCGNVDTYPSRHQGATLERFLD